MAHGDIQRKHKEEEKHSKLTLTNFEEGLRMLEEWLINPRINGEYCMKVVGIEGVLKALDKGKIKNFVDIKEENMQQQPMRSNNKFQQTRSNMYNIRDKLDI